MYNAPDCPLFASEARAHAVQTPGDLVTETVPNDSTSVPHGGRQLVLWGATLGWMCAGFQLTTNSLAMRSAASELLATDDEALVGLWFARYICAFLLGAALGGFVFGALGDRIGRAKAMGLSILTYSLFAGLTYWVDGPWRLLALRFVTCMGVGGMWPNGVALVSETFSSLSKAFVAGLIGMAANLGMAILASVAGHYPIEAESWRWVFLFGASPALLGLLVLWLVPESPRWLVDRNQSSTQKATVSEIFRRPLLRTTLVGIALGTVPLLGGWGSANWVMPWAGQVGAESMPPDPYLKAHLQTARAVMSIFGALLGGFVATQLGRRRSYFLISLGALVTSQWLFWFLTPGETSFFLVFAVQGFFNGLYFGWLPFCLPELFPTRVRSTGAGVSFNWGRILSAVAVFAGGVLLSQLGGYAQLGRLTSLIFVVGMIVILFAPDPAEDT